MDVMAQDEVRVRLDADLKRKLLEEPAGSGGFQSQRKRLRQKIQGDELVLTAEEVAELKRYRADYGSGGFQRLLDQIDLD
jgi:hypothetical protein